MIVTALRTDGNQRYSCTKNSRSLFVKGDTTAHLALQQNQLMCSAAFSASSRLFDLKIEASRFRKKNISAAIVADVKRFCYAIKADHA
jgi:hypothetical protein